LPDTANQIRMFRLSIFSILLIPASVAIAQVHPVTYFTKADAVEVGKNIESYSLLNNSYRGLKRMVDEYVGTDVDVPYPKDPAGGYTHDKHKSNYMLMFNSGILYNITGDVKYANLVKGLLLKYAVLNPTLRNHPQSTNNSPGRIFWQALNDANWLVYAGMSYDLVYNFLNSSERKIIEEGAFKPEVDFLTKDLQEWYDRLHNHSVWACAGVGIVGIATHNKDYLDMALYGSKRDGKSGFIAQMDFLFSPDGYYTEGPYYVRYAILPYMLFANAVNNFNPSLKIFEHRNRILQKALFTCLQQTNTDGVFFPWNDALKDKDFTSNEIVTAISIAWKVYGEDAGMLTVANRQKRVMIDKGGLSIASAIKKLPSISWYYPYTSIESTDGVKGNEGGVSILRNGSGESLTSLIFKYSAQGFGHGHFDKLNINLFDKGNEIFQDYGSARFIGIEQKYGGRYLPENAKYAAQTIAHNTMVVDENSHFDGDWDIGQQFHPEKLFSDIKDTLALVVAAKDENAYKGVQLKRNLYMLTLPGQKKLIVDIFEAASPDEHTYDLPFHYNGQVIHTSFKYSAHLSKMETLGKKNGYQFLWKEAEALVNTPNIQFTFLNGYTYYTITSLIQDSAKVVFARSGANDPNFNVRREPAYIIRKNGRNQVFVNVLEIHGRYDPVNEFSSDAYPSVKDLKLLYNDSSYTVAEFVANGQKVIIAQCNTDFTKDKKHSVADKNNRLAWTGPFAIHVNGERFNSK
jgi:oligo-alginate lyase